ncbi:heat repeat protein [Colletotrichum scovillei]|uniref:Heat repeat protein n=1 Tax=Colletotrichum scovillei TaxID=1209932 RepID=A0A9P7R4S4_9PEZI|nr:heat repeat protein [Colletotrichum scovillei]KAG7069240.1 heat repeat protein [Colletotrichum scovillei]KAG7073218.1 heat repeat protein [Colletotrichum scovillei]
MADPDHTFQHRESVASHERRFGEAVRRSLSQQSRVSLVASPSNRSSNQSFRAPQPPSRTSSRRREVNRFARQLEIYAERRKAAGELPVSTPTPESVISLHTVTALLPYEEQFQAVGLAVTSEQQRQKSPPKQSPEKDMKMKNSPEVITKPISRPKETRKQVEPGQLQLNGLRSASTSSSDSSTSGTQVAFAQPDAWELAFIDEVPAKKESSTSRCCNLPCFQNTRDQLIDVTMGRPPPAPTPTTIDTPNKILAKWDPVYPQKTEALQGWRDKASRDVRAKTWHGNTAQRPSTYRPPREGLPSRNETEAPSPKSKSPRKVVPHDLEDDKPPIPPRAQARTDRSRKQSKAPKLETSAPKGIRKESQQNRFSDQENFPPGGKVLPAIAKTPVKATVLSESDENTAQVQTQDSYNNKIPTVSKQPAGVVDKPLRVSIRQPERKAKEKVALLNKPTQTDFEHPPIFQSGRMFRSLPGPAKLPEMERRERSAQTSHGTITPNPALPSTWKLTLSSSSSLEVAMEAASREMEIQEAMKSRHETLRGQDLEADAQAIPYMAAEVEHDEPLPEPVSEEAPLPSGEQPEEGRKPLRGSDNSDPKEQDDKDIDDRDVLRGLHIAISAACDEEVDAWIRQKTGVRIRRFLADLKAFETLGEEDQPDPAKERARNRRADSRKLKAQIRQSKAAREARAAAQ